MLRAVCTALAAALTCEAILENTVWLRTRTYETDFPGLPRILVVSDLHRRHFGRGQCRLIRQCAAAKPELIAVTGDLVSRTVRDFRNTEQLLRALRRLAPVVLIFGNHETDLPPACQRQFRALCRRCGVTLLENAHTEICGVHIAGLSLPRSFYRGGGLFGFTGAEDCTVKTLRSLLGSCPPGTLLLAHNPLFFPAYAEWGARLTLSGHIHGGAVRLPGIGGLLSPERRFLPQYDRGHFRLGTAEMIVSGGLGKLRLFNPPELCILTPQNPPGSNNR